MLLDGDVFHLLWRARDVIGVRRLTGSEREMALRLIDDVHAEIDAVLRGKN